MENLDNNPKYIEILNKKAEKLKYANYEDLLVKFQMLFSPREREHLIDLYKRDAHIELLQDQLQESEEIINNLTHILNTKTLLGY